MDAEGHVYTLLYGMASVLCKSHSGNINPTASPLRSFPVMKTITLYLHMSYLPGFSGLKWWGVAWLSVPPAARQWLGRLTHPKIWLTDTNVRSLLLQHECGNVRHTCLATQVGPAISAASSTKIHNSFSFFLFWCQSLNELSLEEESSLIVFLPHQEMIDRASIWRALSGWLMRPWLLKAFKLH